MSVSHGISAIRVACLVLVSDHKTDTTYATHNTRHTLHCTTLLSEREALRCNGESFAYRAFPAFRTSRNFSKGLRKAGGQEMN